MELVTAAHGHSSGQIQGSCSQWSEETVCRQRSQKAFIVLFCTFLYCSHFKPMLVDWVCIGGGIVVCVCFLSFILFWIKEKKVKTTISSCLLLEPGQDRGATSLGSSWQYLTSQSGSSQEMGTTSGIEEVLKRCWRAGNRWLRSMLGQERNGGGLFPKLDSLLILHLKIRELPLFFIL